MVEDSIAGEAVKHVVGSEASPDDGRKTAARRPRHDGQYAKAPPVLGASCTKS